MTRTATIALALACVPLLAGCFAARPAPTPLVVRTPVAAIVSVETSRSWEGFPPPQASVWRVPLDGGTPSLLTTAVDDPRPRLSPDGRHLLYARFLHNTTPAIPRYSVLELHSLDVSSGVDTALLTGEIHGIGWTNEGDAVAVTGTGGGPYGDALEDVVVRTRVGAGWREQPAPSLQGTYTADISYICSSGAVLFFEETQVDWDYHGSTIYAFDTTTGYATRVLGPGGFSKFGHGEVEQLAMLRRGMPDQPNEALDTRGLPLVRTIATSLGDAVLQSKSVTPLRTDEVVIRLLPGLREVRSFEVTQTRAQEEHAPVPILDERYTRCAISLVTTSTLSDLTETDVSTGKRTTLLKGTPDLPRPRPLGYIGPDLLIRSTVTTTAVVTLRLYDRATGEVRTLGDVGLTTYYKSGRYENTTDLPWSPDIAMLGVVYAK
jgi:hypothetical protein